MSRSRLLLLVIGVALSALIVVALARTIDVSEAVATLERTSIPVVAFAMGIALLGYFLRAIRWGVILAPRARPRLYHLVSATLIGFFAVNVLPARIGELVRAYTLARSERLPTATVLGSVAVERVLDLCVLGLFWALSLFFAPLPGWFRWSGLATIGICGAGAVALWVFLASSSRLDRQDHPWFRRLPEPIREGLAKGLPAFREGLQIFRSPGALLRAGGWSILVWVVGGGVFLAVGDSLDLRLPFWSIFFMSFIVSVGILIPSSPGFVGVLEGACVVGLAVLGVPGPQALAFGIIFHVVQLLPLTILGTYFTLREHVLPEFFRSPGEAKAGSERKD
jgi:uncharacterized protein (TIRG00374 family)